MTILLYGIPVSSIKISCADQLSCSESSKNKGKITTRILVVILRNNGLKDSLNRYAIILQITKFATPIKSKSSNTEYNTQVLLNINIA
jgi:hypothetical protein